MIGTSGKFLKVFPNVGEFHFSTGLIDGKQLAVTGTIVVTPAIDKPKKLNVRVGGMNAVHLGNSDNTQPTSDECQWPGTSLPNPPKKSEGFWVTYSYGATPVMKSITYKNTPKIAGMTGNAPDTQITAYFNGKNGINTITCKNDVRILAGKFECQNQPNNDSRKVICKVDPRDELDTQKPQVRVVKNIISYFSSLIILK